VPRGMDGNTVASQFGVRGFNGTSHMFLFFKIFYLKFIKFSKYIKGVLLNQYLLIYYF